MEEKEILEKFTKKLIQTNYIEMLKKKNKAEISDFMNNQKNISCFLYALGASEEMLSMPAHRETLENCLKSMISSTLEAMDGETGLEVKYLENGIKTNIESLRYGEKYRLEFSEDMYTFEVTRNIGEKDKKVKGSVEKGLIASYSKRESTSWPVESSEVLSKKELDEDGFVICETVQSTDGKKDIKREGIKNFVDDSKKGIAWNGSPDELNEKSASAKEFQTNMCHIILKYPETKSYYERIVGKDMVEQVVKMLAKGEHS